MMKNQENWRIFWIFRISGGRLPLPRVARELRDATRWDETWDTIKTKKIPAANASNTVKMIRTCDFMTSVGCYRIAVGYYRTLAQNNKNAETNESSIQKFLKTNNII